MKLIQKAYPMTDVLMGRWTLKQQMWDMEKAVWEQLEPDQTGYRINPVDMKAIFDAWYEWKLGRGPHLNEIQND